MAPAVRSVLKHNLEGCLTDPMKLRYNSLKLNWSKLTRWARESFVYCASHTYNELGLHGRLFADYEDMRDQIRCTLVRTYGNANVK